MSTTCSHREFLAALAATAPGLGIVGRAAEQAHELPPIRTITRGPRFHWHRYYDKLLFDPANHLVLCKETDFEHRSPRPEDEIRVGMVDIADGDKWTELGATCAWNWQQRCMCQWVPGQDHEVLWNDRQDGQFVCHILNLKTGKQRTLPHAIYTLSPDGLYGLTTDFRRLNDCRPGYGYAGVLDPNRNVPAPEDSGNIRGLVG